jgi:hypothetical protein
MRYIDHPDQDLNPRAFQKESGRLKRVYGKSDPPPAPDYAAAAQQTAAGNLDMAKYATEANRVNQYTPYGSLTYSQDPNNENKWSQTMNLTPQAQAALDQQLALNQKYGETANIGFDRARELFENPQLDTSLLPDRAINVGQTAQDALMSRLQPQLAQQDEALRARLANQGIGLGSEAYGREQNLAGQRRNDLELQAALQGINLDQANRSAALQEQAYLQDRPLNLINALRTGNQVQSPQFQQFAQQATTAGPDMLGAANAQYQADVSATNAQNAAFGNTLGGLFSLGGTILGAPTGSIAGGLFGLR